MSTQPDFDTMTDAELAQYHYTHRDNPLGDDADLEEIEVEIAHPLSVPMSFRLPPEEASAIRNAAEQAGMSMSDWVRRVCSAATEAGTPVHAPVPSQRVNMTKARRLVAELDRELNRIVEQAEVQRHGQAESVSELVMDPEWPAPIATPPPAGPPLNRGSTP